MILQLLIALPEVVRLLLAVKASVDEANKKAEIAKAVEEAKKKIEAEHAANAASGRPNGEFWKKP